MLGLPLGPDLKPCIKHSPSPILKGERIRFHFERIEAPSR